MGPDRSEVFQDWVGIWSDSDSSTCLVVSQDNQALFIAKPLVNVASGASGEELLAEIR